MKIFTGILTAVMVLSLAVIGHSQTIQDQFAAGVEVGNLALIKSAVVAGAEVDVPLKFGYTALVTAASRGRADIVKVLLDAGADVNLLDGAVGNAALHYAASDGHTGVVKMLLEAGADVNLQGEGHPTFALMGAVENGHVEIVKRLLDAGARFSDFTLEIAEMYGQTEVAQLLRQYLSAIQDR